MKRKILIQKDFPVVFKKELDFYLGSDYSEDVWFDMGMDFGVLQILNSLFNTDYNLVFENYMQLWDELKENVDAKISDIKWSNIGKKVWLKVIQDIKYKYQFNSWNNIIG